MTLGWRLEEGQLPNGGCLNGIETPPVTAGPTGPTQADVPFKTGSDKKRWGVRGIGKNHHTFVQVQPTNVVKEGEE